MINLKVSFAFLLLIIFFSNLSYSQEFTYGISFGMGQTSGIFEEENYTNSSNSEGNYNVTAFVFLPSTSILRFQTGFKYFKVGYNVDFDVDFDGRTKVVASPNNVGREFSFVAIPLNLNHRLSFFNNAYLSGGLEVAYIVSAYSYKSYGMEPIRVDISELLILKH